MQHTISIIQCSDFVAVVVTGKGGNYLTPKQARAMAKALKRCAKAVEQGEASRIGTSHTFYLED